MLRTIRVAHRIHHKHLGTPAAANARVPSPPLLRTSQHRPAPAGWLFQQRATYYFDATWHTAQTLRRLMRATLAMDDLGLRQPQALLAQATDSLLHTICPGLPDDAASHSYYRKLLHAHLSALGSAELEQFAQLLKAQRFGCAVMESVVDDKMLSEHGFANGPPHQRQRSLMFTPDLHAAIGDAAKAAAATEARFDAALRLSPAQAQRARDLLAAFASRHAEAGIAMKDFTGIAAELAHAIGLATPPTRTIAATPLPPVSCVDWQQEQLIIDLPTLATLIESRDPGLYATVQRDLLELLLARKLFGPGADLMTLKADQRSLLFREVEQVLALAPAAEAGDLQASAAQVLARGTTFGTVQVCPTAGVALGHAWIAPVLSVVPDRTQAGRAIGTRFMRSGMRLDPAQSMINEWEIRWLSPRENDDLYPAEEAWHVRVPADRLALQRAAAGIMQEWRQKALPYRFVGTEPGMPATGCRVTVWQTVQRAMDDDARRLFMHFQRGLPEPESPTELALRFEQFMGWLVTLAARRERADL